jgi:hypothetical protein
VRYLRPPDRSGETQADALRDRGPAFPREEDARILDVPRCLVQNSEEEIIYRYRPVPLSFGREILIAAHLDDPAFQVNILPGQGDDLSNSQARVECYPTNV